MARKSLGSVYKRHRKWWINFVQDGVRVRQPTDATSKDEANAILADKLGTRDGTISIRNVLDGLVEDWEIRNIKSLDSAINHVKPLRAILSNMTVDELNASRLRSYIRRRMDDGISNAKINRELSALRRGLNLARMDGLIKDVVPIPRLREDNVRTGFLTKIQVERIANTAPEYLSDFIRYAFYSGWRKGEISSLTWDEVDIRRRMIRLAGHKTKTNEIRVLPITGELLNVLNRRQGVKVGEFVFHHGNGSPIVQCYKGLKSSFKRAGFEKNTFHDIRRSAVRRLIVGGVPQILAMRITGHKTTSVFNRYAIFQEQDLRDALDMLEREEAVPVKITRHNDTKNKINKNR
jgi:integrase